MTLPTKVTIAVLTDIHAGPGSAISSRRSEIAETLLLRAVMRLNRMIHPDVTVILGDIVDDGTSADSHEWLAAMTAILDKLASPSIVIPGNHDGDVGAFYRVFDRPAEMVDLCGVRFLPFIDSEEPGYNASRSRHDIERFRRARVDHSGPIVALQHVCLAPPGQTDVPYNYTNAEEIIEAMGKSGVALSISGHHHAGAPMVSDETTAYVTAPSLCESPFMFTTVTVEGDRISTTRHQLAMPAELSLVDRHVHTQLAYCSENMDVAKAIELAYDFGLAGIGFSEHSGQLTFPRQDYWQGAWAWRGLDGAQPKDNRIAAYLELKRQYQRDGVTFGIEADVDYEGNLVLEAGLREQFDHVLGAIHRTPSLGTPPPDRDKLEEEFRAVLAQVLACGVDVLAHPFRLFRRAGYEPPEELFAPTAEHLREHGTAMELNYHTNQPPVAFVRLCLERDVKISLGSDAHNLYEVGEFADHLQVLRDAGFDGDLSDILLPRDYRARNG